MIQNPKPIHIFVNEDVSPMFTVRSSTLLNLKDSANGSITKAKSRVVWGHLLMKVCRRGRFECVSKSYFFYRFNEVELSYVITVCILANAHQPRNAVGNKRLNLEASILAHKRLYKVSAPVSLHQNCQRSWLTVFKVNDSDWVRLHWEVRTWLSRKR